MKCVACGYDDPKNEKTKFIEVNTEHGFEQNSGWSVNIYACPKCGTLKTPDNY